jgi:hypothetical protein
MRSHCRKSIRIRSILITVRRMITRTTKSIRERSVFAIKFTYSVNARTLSQSIEHRDERKTSKLETRRDRKFSKNSTCFIRSNE